MADGPTFSRLGLGTLMLITVATGCSPAESIGNPSDGPAAEAHDPVGDAAAPRESSAPAIPEEAAAPEPILVVPAGTEMKFRLGQSLTTESSRAGDPFSATLIEDVVSSTGEVLVPFGARADGIVTASQESQSSDAAAILQLGVEMLVVHGEPRPIAATVTHADQQTETRDSGGETAAKIAAGTAAGAIVGGLLGDGRGALIGAGAGAVAGTAVAVSTDDGQARMEEGATLTVVLDEALEIW